MNIPQLADSINRLRVIPRLLVAGYGYLIFDTHFWIKELGTVTDTQQWYANVVWVGGAAIFKFYVETGGAPRD